TINGVDIYNAHDLEGAALTAADVATAANARSAETGVTVVNDAGTLTFTAEGGRDIVIAETLGGAATGGLDAAAEGTARGTISLSAGETITLGGQFADIGHAETIGVSGSLATTDIKTVESANTAMQ